MPRDSSQIQSKRESISSQVIADKGSKLTLKLKFPFTSMSVCLAMPKFLNKACLSISGSTCVAPSLSNMPGLLSTKVSQNVPAEWFGWPNW